jgi:hypothetical protein
MVARMRVTSEADPSVLPRLLGYLHNLNHTPRRVSAEFGIHGHMYLEIDVCGLPEGRVSLITAKIGQAPSVLTAYWYRL